MASHTKAPWNTEISPGLKTQIVCVFGSDEEETMVCECYEGADEEREANARLIGAAPDLLDALVLALPYVECAEEDRCYKQGAVAKVLATMRAAINKAEAA